jgi:hypothetical protein
MAVRCPCVVATIFIIPACAGDANLAEVSGTVTLDGRLVQEGSIQFIPIDGTSGPSIGAVIKDGKYHIERKNGVAVGRNRVELRAFRETGGQVPDPTGPRGSKIAERVPAFPPEYNERSTVVRDVKPGSNTINFDINVFAPAK